MEPAILAHMLPDPANPDHMRELACAMWQEDTPQRSLICVHGLTRQGRDFDMLARCLKREYRVLAPDMAGRGKSSRLSDPALYANTTYLADIDSLLARFNVGEIDWVGTSMGGILGMMMAASQPERIRRLVLNDIGAFIPRTGLLRLRDYVGKRVEFGNFAEAEAALREITEPFGIQDEAVWREFAEHSIERQPDRSARMAYDPAIGHAFADESKIQDIDLWPLWDAIKCPVLVLRGAKSDILSHETASKMQAKDPARVTYMEIPGVGHAPSLTRDEEITLVRRWLLSA